MERIEKLESDVQKYLRLRKIFRTIEVFASLAVIIVLLILGSSFVCIIACLCGIIFIPEVSLAIQRIEIKVVIKDENLLAQKELEFCSEMKTECEKIRGEFIAIGSKKDLSDECNELVWKEEMGIGWISNKMKEFENRYRQARETIDDLAFIKRLVNY